MHDGLETCRIGVVLGSNKCGKTWGGTGQSCAWMYGYRIWDVPNLKLTKDGDYPPREQVPTKYWITYSDGRYMQVPNTGMITTGLTRERGIGQVIHPCFKDLLPPAIRDHVKYREVKGPQGVVTEIRLPNGSRAIMASADQSELTFEGTRIQWAWCDEPVRPFVFNGLWRGLSIDGGPILFTLTPLGNDATWMYMKWVAFPTKEAVVTKVAMTDNPALSPKLIKEFEENGEWTEAEKKARLYGEFESLGTSVIHNFRRDVHVVAAHLLPVDWIHGMTVDPHHVKPAAVIWWKVSPEGVYHIYREWPTKTFTKLKTGGKTPTDYAILFRTIEANDPPKIRLADPRFGKSEHSNHGVKSTSWVDAMAESGLYFDARIDGVGKVETGEQKIINMLRYDSNFPIGPTNTPKIIIHDCCNNMIQAMMNYGLVTSRDNTKTEEKRSEEYKDFIDALRYTVLYRIISQTASAGHDQFSDRDWEQENGGDWP